MKTSLLATFSLSLLLTSYHISAQHLNDSPSLYVAKVVSDFAGKKIIEDCGKQVEGIHTKVSSKKCQDSIANIKDKIQPTVKDCELKLLPTQTCTIIYNVQKSLSDLEVNSA